MSMPLSAVKSLLSSTSAFAGSQAAQQRVSSSACAAVVKTGAALPNRVSASPAIAVFRVLVIPSSIWRYLLGPPPHRSRPKRLGVLRPVSGQRLVIAVTVILFTKHHKRDH